jgi:hypothetical protein
MTGDRNTYEIVVLWSVLLEQRVGGKVCCITTGCKNDSSVFGVLDVRHAGKRDGGDHSLSFDTSDSFTILDDLVDLGLLEDLDPIRGVLSEVFELTISERL